MPLSVNPDPVLWHEPRQSGRELRQRSSRGAEHRRRAWHDRALSQAHRIFARHLLRSRLGRVAGAEPVDGVDVPLEAGMCFHIPIALREYGAFTEGLSESIVITEEGCRVFGQVPRRIHVI